MARIISRTDDPAGIANRGERLVFKAIRKCLPDYFLAFHDLPFLREHAIGKNLVDGQIDFVVLDQRRGVLLVFEVKDGAIECRTDGNSIRTYQNGALMDVDPWTQANGNKYSLVEWMAGKLACDPKAFPLSHGHAVLLPGVHTPIGNPKPNMQDDVAITWVSDGELAQRIEACSDAWLMKGRRTPSEAEIEDVRKLLMPDFVYGNTLRDRIGVERRELREHRVCAEQLLEFVGNRKRARIAGCAGAGKTVLAAAKARQLAAEAKDVLFLVYNKALCGYLRQHLADTPGVTVQTFHDFCHECCGPVWPAAVQTDPAFWWNRVPELLDKALADKPPRYDALLVDEAQDFQYSAWLALERVVKPDGWYYIFYDKEQNVFRGDLQWPVQEAPFLLLRHCRSTKAILAAITRRTGVVLQPGDGLVQGEPVREERAATPAQRRRILGKILHEWIRNEGLSENQIVVLGAHTLGHTCLENTGKAGSFHIEARGAPAPGRVPYYTYMAFKGCEADAVILLDVDNSDQRWDKAGLYSAMTRTRHLLAVVEVGSL